MKKTIFLGTFVIGLIGLSLSACAHKKQAVPPPAPSVPVAQPLTVQQAPAPAPTHRAAGNFDYVKK